MKKVFGQTVRDLKREVNKKVLKVPGIEQKVLDATSNEPWGPHGSLLADLAQASRNYHEYQLIMGVLWKRLSDTGKNWRHVYKALTVLEYMVGHGSERVIDEIRERAYQISTLSDFQYIDSGGRDQGSNVRKKSQSLVALVNDKERIAEVREKASANRDKYRTSAPGGMYKPSGGYGDKYDYGSRDEERSSYGREREYGYRDDDRNSRDGDRHSRDSEDRYGRDGNREDDYRGRSRSVDNFQTGSRGRSSDRDRTFEDDGHSSRGSGARADDNSQDGRGQLQRKFSEQNIGAPPSYEDAVSDSKSPVYSERDGGETPQVAAPGVASPPPPQSASPGAASPHPPQTASPPPPQVAAPGAASPPAGSNTNNNSAAVANESSPQKFEAFDEFDPRGAFSAGPPAYASADGVSAPPAVASTSAPPTSNSVEMDLLGSLADVFSSNALAIVPADSTSVETNGQPNAPSFSTSQPSTQTFDDPFGDSPFKAFTSADTDSNPQQSFGAPFQATPPAFTTEATHTDSAQNFGFGDSFSAVANPEPAVQNVQPPSNPQDFPQDQFDTSQSDIDILAGILPPSGPPASLPQQSSASVPTSQFPPSGNNMYHEGYHPQPVSSAPKMPGQTPFGQAGPPASLPQQPGASVPTSQFPPSGNNMYEGYHPQPNMPGQTPFGQQYNMVPPHSQNMGGATPYHNGGFMHQPGSASYNPGAVTSHPTSESFHPRPVAATSSSSQTPYSNPSGPAGQFMGHQGHGMPPSHGLQRTQSVPVNMQGNNNFMGDMFGPTSSLTSSSSHQDLTPLTGAIEIVPQPQKKFEPKSSVWADTLSRGLVNFNISGPKTNPLADIGVDFEAINRREKRLEKPTNAPAPTSTINMGKAMGSGTGLGRAGANSMRPPPNPMVASGMPMGGGINVGGYGGMNQNQPMGGMGMGPGMTQNQPMGGMGMGPGMNMNQNQPMGMGMGPGMNMGGGYGQGYQMQPQHQGMVPGQNMPGNNNNYNPMMGQGGYNPQQQQYGGGYR